MEMFRFFISIWPILLILRISTGQRFSKERSLHEACMGWIIERTKRLNSISTDSDSHKNSWRCLGFSFPFCWFCWFWGFQLGSGSGRSGLFMKLVWDESWRAWRAWIPSTQMIPIHKRIHGDIKVFHFHFADFADFGHFHRPALQEGAIGSRGMCGLYYGGIRVLEFHWNRFQFPQAHMGIFRYFISIWLIWLILRISTSQHFSKEQFVHEACMGWIMEAVESLNSM